MIFWLPSDARYTNNDPVAKQDYEIIMTNNHIEFNNNYEITGKYDPL
jgi:hypothetical protein